MVLVDLIKTFPGVRDGWYGVFITLPLARLSGCPPSVAVTYSVPGFIRIVRLKMSTKTERKPRRCWWLRLNITAGWLVQ